MDGGSLAGTLLGALVILVAAIFEGLPLEDLFSFGALLLVFGGTLAALLLSFPWRDVFAAFSMLGSVYFSEAEVDVAPLVEEITRVATIARKEGVLAVEGQKESIRNPLFKKALRFVIDGFEPATVREIIDGEIAAASRQNEMAGQVWERAGFYAVRLGGLGTVLGLIRVFRFPDDFAKMGGGFAASLVALLYGVSAANLLFAPWGSKLKRNAVQGRAAREIVKLGVIGIQEGTNPHFLEQKLAVFSE